MKKTLLILFALIILTLVISLFFISGKQTPGSVEQLNHLPWQINVLENGRIEVFGLNIPDSSLQDAMTQFPREPQIKVFRDQDESLSVEALFERVTLSGIIANLIMTLDVDETQKQQLEKNAIKREPMPTGAYELTLSEDDQATLSHTKIIAITYTPYSVQLDQKMVESRFGPAKETFNSEEGVTTLFYHERGLAVTINTNKRQKEIFQYIAPRDFDHLRQTLYGEEIP